MFKRILLFTFVLFVITKSQAQEVKVITIVESVVPMGAGRSKIIEQKTNVNHKDFTTERADGKKSKSKNIRRSDIKIDTFAETKLLNFYSGIGINFQNIASNDAVISSKINDLILNGWDLIFVTSAVESDAGKDDG